MDENKKDRRNIKPVIITVLICFLVFGALLVGMNWEKWFGDAPDNGSSSTGGTTLQIDGDAGEYVAPSTTSASGEGIAIPGWGSITIQANKTDVVVDFPNPTENADKYYLTFELTLKDTGEVLYKSGLVKPGLHIQNITLNRPLEAGEYDAVIKVQPYKMNEAQTPTNNADMETKLIVVD